MSLTSTTTLEGTTPKDPWSFARQLENSQPLSLNGNHTILFNKGRYFETTIGNKELREPISELTGIPVQYGNMIVASWTKLEDFVIAMNIMGYYIKIDVDWI